MHANDISDLTNMVLEYTYSTGDRVVLTIEQETLSFEWFGGQLDGTRIEGLVYQCKKTREKQFLINWHNTNAHSFVALLIDIEEKRVYGAALVEYLGDSPLEIFDEAIITNISDLK